MRCTHRQSEFIKNLGHPGKVWGRQIYGSTDEKQAEHHKEIKNGKYFN